jgi:hypothetical protein
MSPEVQAKVDQLNAWIKQQLSSGKEINQKRLDSMNADIRAFQASHNKISGTRPSPESMKGKLITKQGMVGNSYTVPEGKQWKVKRVFVSDGNGHNVLIGSISFSKVLDAGEKLTTPAWSAEANLLSNDISNLSYIFEIEESDKESNQK